MRRLPSKAKGPDTVLCWGLLRLNGTRWRARPDELSCEQFHSPLKQDFGVNHSTPAGRLCVADCIARRPLLRIQRPNHAARRAPATLPKAAAVAGKRFWLWERHPAAGQRQAFRAVSRFIYSQERVGAGSFLCTPNTKWL
ncbi:hypothetical protein GCM10022409_43180 [Hymenobacter glaciei]|uniref:Transposase n=1 Tax=Hymenobacter glaciei TaxID=877209 RepID=A0ABP7UTF4_9BACT